MAIIDTSTQRNTLAVQKVQTSPLRPSDKQEQTTKAEQAAGDNKLKDRIIHWFARAGVSPNQVGGLQTDINKKLLRRRQIIEQKKLANLESIMELATDYCPDAGSNDHLDPDWFFSFVQMAEDIHSPLMQELWGKIFAVEIAKSGSFSLNTLKILKQLTQRDANIFKKASSIASRQKGHAGAKIITGFYQKPSVWNFFSSTKLRQLNLAEFNLSYPEVLSLIDLNLIYASEIESAELDTQVRIEWACGKESFHLAPKNAGLALNYYKFTATGVELMKLVNSSANTAYLTELKRLFSTNFEVL